MCMNAGDAVFPEHGRENWWSGRLTKNADIVRFGRRGVGVSHCCAERSVSVPDTSTVGTPTRGRDQSAGHVVRSTGFPRRPSKVAAHRTDPLLRCTDGPVWAYRVVSAEEHGCARVVWDGPSEHTSGTLLATNADEDERTARGEATAFLEDYLSTGRRPAAEVKKAGKAADIAPRTLDRARKRANVLSYRDGFGPGSAYYWHLDGQHVRQEADMDAMDASYPELVSKASMASMNEES